MPRGDHSSMWGGVCLPAWIGSRTPHWDPLSLVPRPQTGQRETGRRGWRCGEQSCPCCLHNPTGGLQSGLLCCSTLGNNNWCCGVALPASTAGSSGTPDLGGGASMQWMAHHLASLQPEAMLKSGPVNGHGWREQMTEDAGMWSRRRPARWNAGAEAH